MRSGALDSYDLLLSCPLLTLASHITIILISTLKHKTYLYLSSVSSPGGSMASERPGTGDSSARTASTLKEDADGGSSMVLSAKAQKKKELMRMRALGT